MMMALNGEVNGQNQLHNIYITVKFVWHFTVIALFFHLIADRK